MANKILYKSSVSKDLNKIDHPQRIRIMSRIESELSKDPCAGKLLSGDFEGLRSFRVGVYRVIYTTIPEGVLILRISHRKESYR